VAAASKSPPNKGAKSKKSAGAKASVAPPSGPLIDTSLAAQAAARMLAAGFAKAPQAAPASAPGAARSSDSSAPQESALFRQIKAGLNKPHAATMSSVLEKSHGPEPVKPHREISKQVGHNQTFLADVTRSGVPRRTPG
jgi:hypothetical protein